MVIAARFAVTVKKFDYNRNFDQNWAWPEKTWFRERLNAVRAREDKVHRRAVDAPKDIGPLEAKPSGEQDDREG